MRTKFLASLQAWGTAGFADTLKHEIEGLPPGTLPLLEDASCDGLPDDTAIQVMVFNSDDSPQSIQCRVGIFFREIIAGCSCGDEPFPQNVYREMLVRIDKSTGNVEFELLA
jgi:hypothetical protein